MVSYHRQAVFRSVSIVALPLRLGGRSAANRLVALIEGYQARHLVILLILILAVDTLRVVGKDRLRDNVRSGYQRLNDARVLLERMALGHEGRESEEVKLDVGEGITVCQEELAESLYIDSEAGVRESENIVILAICVTVVHDEVIVNTADRDLIVLRVVLGKAEKD